MPDVDLARNTLFEVAKQAYSLAVGLQNIAPPQSSVGPSHSISYLTEIAHEFDATRQLLDIDENQLRINDLIRDVIQKDVLLREKYQMGDKFRFVRDRLQGLQNHLEEIGSNQKIAQQKKQTQVKKINQDEMLVYVYLYNSQGTTLRNWQPMLIPKLFYEYGVNRPLYTDKSQIEVFIRSKPNKSQHAYLTVIIKKSDLIESSDESLKDSIGNSLVKVKEGALHFDQFVSFTQAEQNYILNEDGVLLKMPEGI